MYCGGESIRQAKYQKRGRENQSAARRHRRNTAWRDGVSAGESGQREKRKPAWRKRPPAKIRWRLRNRKLA
jgi:hypothetical protein